MQFTGLHHLTAITADASGNHAFFTGVLGMRLVKRTVNQDDVSAYHLFYADGLASPGSDVTFFDWPAAPERRGSGAIVRTALRVAGADTLAWWARRFDAHGVAHGSPAERDGRATLDFEDPEGQRLSLVDDGGAGAAHPWERSPVPPAHQIRGLGPVTLSVPALDATAAILTGVMEMRAERRYRHDGTEVHVFAMGEGGPASELHVAVEPHLPRAQQGAGGVHHVAFRTPDIEQYRAWNERLHERRVASSGPIDRHYFRSLYFREPAGILFEIATDGPGFDTDEPMDSLGERLALPPFLEARRGEIEAGLKPI
jgi:glyoxalase family protein